MYFAAQAAIYLDLSQFAFPGATRRVSPFPHIFAGMERAGAFDPDVARRSIAVWFPERIINHEGSDLMMAEPRHAFRGRRGLVDFGRQERPQGTEQIRRIFCEPWEGEEITGICAATNRSGSLGKPAAKRRIWSRGLSE